MKNFLRVLKANEILIILLVNLMSKYQFVTKVWTIRLSICYHGFVYKFQFVSSHLTKQPR